MPEELCDCRVYLHEPTSSCEIEQFQKHLLNFGTVAFGSKTCKTFRLENTSGQDVEVEVVRDPATNPIYQAFEFNATRCRVRRGSSFEMKVFFCPKVPSETSIEYVQIKQKSLAKMRVLQMKGECKGFNMQLSATRLYFYKSPDSQKVRQVIELKNNSAMDTHYQFTVAENENFSIDKSYGIVLGNSFEFITIVFKPHFPGCFYTTTYCLSSYCQPLLLELIGMVSGCKDFTFDNVNLQAFPLNYAECKGFGGYLYAEVKFLNFLPPFTLGKTFYDFGRVAKECNIFKSSSATISLTNNLENPIDVHWTNTSDVFEIKPKNAEVGSLEHAMFEVKFSPKRAEAFYLKSLTANINWTDDRDVGSNSDGSINVNLPLLATVRLTGNSFPERNNWIPHVEILPNVVTLPITVPNSTSYTTFILKSHGYLPTFYKFIAPRKTNFVVKPMIGVLKNFDLIVVQLHAGEANRKQYIECWGLEFNGVPTNTMSVYLKAYAELPMIDVGCSNKINFPPIQFGCEGVLEVRMKNVSGHHVEYKFCVEEYQYISLDRPQGCILSNDIINLTFFLKSSPRTPPSTNVRCELRPIYQMESVKGQPTNAFVKIHADVGYSRLCAIPKNCVIEEILYENKEIINFTLYNFGETELHFTLSTNDETVEIIPTSGSLGHKESTSIMVHLQGRKIGSQNCTLYYELRKNRESCSLIDEPKVEIFQIVYHCVLPHIQIYDIVNHTFSPLFSKLTLWNMLNIDEINNALKTLAANEFKSVYMSIPDSERSPEPVTLELALKNEHNYGIEMRIKRKQMCACKPVVVDKGLSLRKKKFNCPHRELLLLSKTFEIFDAHSRHNLHLTFKYNLDGEHVLCHQFRFCNNRVLDIFTRITVLPIPGDVISAYDESYCLNFGQRFIGAKKPAFNLYNNTKTDMSYQADMHELDVLNATSDFEIISCATSSCDNVVKAFSAAALLFQFMPIEARIYDVEITLMLGTKVCNLHISGEGILRLEPKTNPTILPYGKALIVHEDVHIYLSDEFFEIDNLLTHSTWNKLIFIKNLTKNRIIGYSFKPIEVKGFVVAKVTNPKGALKPKEIKALIVEVRAFDKAGELEFRMICKLLDHTQYVKRKKSEAEYYLKQNELRGQFTITEHGITYPKNDLVLEPKPTFFYKTILFRVTVVNEVDKDIYMNLQQQFQQVPARILTLNADHVANFNRMHCHKMGLVESSESSECDCKRNSRENSQFSLFTLYRDVVENLIGDIINNSKQFKTIVNSLNNAPAPYYHQFKLDNNDGNESALTRRQLCKRIATKPPTAQTLHIINQIILDSFYGSFKLGASYAENASDPVSQYNVTIVKCAP